MEDATHTASQVAEEAPSLASLPLDALAAVCSYITGTKDLNNILRTCRTMHQLRGNVHLQSLWLIRVKGKNRALRLACRRGNALLLRILLATIPPCYQAVVLNQQCVLHEMCGGRSSAGHSQTLQLLLSTPGLDVNKKGKNGCTSLHLGCARGNVEAARQLLEQPGIQAGITSQSGNTPLHEACAANHHSVVELLLNHPAAAASLHTHNGAGMTPLHVACATGHLEAAELLLAAAQNIQGSTSLLNTPCTKHLRTPLHYASMEGHSRIVEMLVGCQVPTALNQRDAANHTALHLACIKGHVAVVCALLPAPGIEANAPDNSNQTPLHLASHQGHADTVMLLLDHPAVDANALTAQHHSPLHLALQFYRVAISEAKLATAWLLLNNSRTIALAGQEEVVGDTVLHHACDLGDVPLVQRLLDMGADVNRLGLRDSSPLHRACRQGHFRVVEVLLHHPGLALDASSALVCLRMACYSNCLAAAKMILAHMPGIIVQGVDDHGMAPIHGACQSGNLEVVQWLLGMDEVDVNVLDSQGASVLHFCGMNQCQPELIQLLLDAGCTHINTRDDSGCTPLHTACQNVNAVSALLTVPGVDVNARGYEGRTPLHTACRRGNMEAIQALVSTPGVDLTAVDNNGDKPWMLATGTNRHLVHDLFQELLGARMTMA